MDDEALKMIEWEMAILVRRIASISPEKRKEVLDRSAYLLLQQISAHGAAGVKTLASELQLDISTVSRQAATLEEKGYVHKTKDSQDRRAYFYQITEQGTNELTAYKQTRLDKFENLLQDWPEEDRKNFGELLQKFNQTIRGRDEGTGTLSQNS